MKIFPCCGGHDDHTVDCEDQAAYARECEEEGRAIRDQFLMDLRGDHDGPASYAWEQR